MTTTYEHKTELVGDDYTGLPTRPAQYRGAPKPTGLPWNEITEGYVANGGQVDPSVWRKRNVELVTGTSASSRRAVHTFETPDDYDEHAEPEQRRATGTGSRKPVKLTDAKRIEIGNRYIDGEGLVSLADAFDVSVTTIRTTLGRLEIQTRPAGRPS